MTPGTGSREGGANARGGDCAAAAGGARSGAVERGGRSAGSEVAQTWTAASKVGGGRLPATARSLGAASGRPRPGTLRWPSLGATHERGAGKGASSLECECERVCSGVLERVCAIACECTGEEKGSESRRRC